MSHRVAQRARRGVAAVIATCLLAGVTLADASRAFAESSPVADSSPVFETSISARWTVPTPTDVDVVLTVSTVADLVVDDLELSLREAIGIASVVGGDIAVELEADETYVVGCGSNDDANVDGDLDFEGSGHLVIRGNGATITLEDECDDERIIHAPDGGAISLIGVELRGGNARGDGGAVAAGRIEVFDSSLVDNVTHGGRGGALFSTGPVVIVDSHLAANRALAERVAPQGVGGAAVSLGSLTVFDSTFESNRAVYDGGALAGGSSVAHTIVGSEFVDNRSDYGRGGAVFLGGDVDADVSDSSFTTNLAAASTAGGGALYVDGSLTVSSSTFTANESRSLQVTSLFQTGGGGGAVYSEGTLEVTSSSFDQNRSGDTGAGGAVSHKGTATMSGSTFSANSSGGAGGAIFVGGGRAPREQVTIVDVLVSGNEARSAGGGGVFLSSTGETRVIASRVTANRALHTGADGGGIFFSGFGVVESTSIDGNQAHGRASGGGLHADVGTDLEIRSSTIADNRAGAGGGLGADFSPAGTIDLIHTTIAGNTAVSGANVAVGAPLHSTASIIGSGTDGTGCALATAATSGGYNVDADGSCGFGAEGDVTAVRGRTLVAPLEAVGTTVAIRRPVSALTIERVPSAVCESAGHDQLGAERSAPCEVGAVELVDLEANDDVVSIDRSTGLLISVTDNDDLAGIEPVVRLVDITPPTGVIVTGTPLALSIIANHEAVSGTIGTYEICRPGGGRCSTASIRVEIIGEPAPSTTTPPTTQPVSPPTIAPVQPTTPTTAVTTPPPTFPPDTRRREVIVVAGRDGSIKVMGESNYVRASGAHGRTDVVAVTSAAANVWVGTANGRVVRFDGSTGESRQAVAGRGGERLVDLAATHAGAGLLRAFADGRVTAHGDARWYGDPRELDLRAPIVAILETPTDRGYWLIGADGGVFAYGDAVWLGSLASLELDAPIVGADTTATGNGIWLFAQDGGVFAFGDALFHGSAVPLTSGNIIGGARSVGGGGYVLVRSGGGLHLFGDAIDHIDPVSVSIGGGPADIDRQ